MNQFKPHSILFPVVLLFANIDIQSKLDTLHQPDVAMWNIKHHDSYIFILIVGLLTLVEELSFHLDQAVKCLVGDQGSISAIELQV